MLIRTGLEDVLGNARAMTVILLVGLVGENVIAA